MSLEDVVKAITVTVELTQTEMSVPARVAMAEDLALYPEVAVLSALRRCRREVRGKLTLADVLTRLDDGRPGAEEAWALYPKDEYGSAAVTTEMQLAMSAAWPLVKDGDPIAGRMAFLEKYRAIIAENRAASIPVKWEVTLGSDVGGREAALVDAVQRKRIGLDHALKLLPGDTQERFLLSAGVTDHPMLAPPTVDVEANKRKLAEIVASIDTALPPEEVKPAPVFRRAPADTLADKLWEKSLQYEAGMSDGKEKP